MTIEAPATVELRCPTCRQLFARYTVPPGSTEPVVLDTKCRRCHALISADLRAGSPTVRLRTA